MTARDRILNAVRAGLPTPRATPDAIAAEARALLDAPEARRPALAAPGLADSFCAKAAALGTTVARLPDLAALPEAVRGYLADHGLSATLALQPAPSLAVLDWSGIERHSAIAPDEPVALGLARWGIAESGSLVIHSGPDTPILLSFLPLHHIVVLHEDRLLPHLEDYAARTAGEAPPRNAILITGPSGTTDIEGSYVRGAHGPGFLHVILIAPEARPAD
ncbi:LutC/YkgG family protein [Paracoccus spongiarum]|uniref:Lactate utilization protein n=1 Tax=Paracoccus spongiarum TaxID=3064387 RepID=A0ABT9JBR1_9RHOB|nr:lactate utilization protein [Paracoccus sp. 2205BS29-5]MDP5307269.1 lactate utilization protein [Paracoccus sp. 2205BS29-5]